VQLTRRLFLALTGATAIVPAGRRFGASFASLSIEHRGDVIAAMS
jgi:hypothetical protein